MTHLPQGATLLHHLKHLLPAAALGRIPQALSQRERLPLQLLGSLQQLEGFCLQGVGF